MIYLYDSTIEGLFTIVYECLKEKKIPKDIKEKKNYEINLFDKYKYIPTNINKSNYVTKYINHNVSSYTLYVAYNTFLSDEIDKEVLIVKYLLNGFKYGHKLNGMYKLECVINCNKISKYVRNEAHKLNGFVRFKEINDGILYSEIEPNNNVIEILTLHFMERLKKERFIIRDKRRNIASFYQNGEYLILDDTKLNYNALIDSKKEDLFTDLWKEFYNTIDIKTRKNDRCRMNFMPKKYWKYIIDMSDEV